MSWSRVAALVCVDCGRDLVYLELSRGRFDGRLHLDHWASRWYGCDCPSRERLVSEQTFEIVEAGGGHDTHVERWGSAE